MNEKSEIEVRASAVAAMDRAFGLGVAEAHKAILTEPVARRIYESALNALVEQAISLGTAPRDEGARWIEIHSIGSNYEEDMDVSRTSGNWRHRVRAAADEPRHPWCEGRAPIMERPD